MRDQDVNEGGNAVRDRGTSVYRCRASVRLIKKMGEFRNRFLGRTAAIRRVVLREASRDHDKSLL